jgi:hypothetical protein
MRTLVDQALAHTPKGKVEAAYNRARYLDQLRDVFQTWADLLEPAGARRSVNRKVGTDLAALPPGEPMRL